MSSRAPVAEPVSDDLKSSEKKALIELRVLLQDAIISNTLFVTPALTPTKRRRSQVVDYGPDWSPEDISDIALWGVPILPSRYHDSTNIVLLKFLRASEFKPLEALEMIQRTLRWRKEFNVDSIANEEVEEPEGNVHLNGVDREGNPVSYNAYGIFKERVSYRKALGNGEMREKFLRSRIRFMEKGVKELSLKPGGAASMLQVIDLKDSSISSMKEMTHIIRKLFCAVDDNYPEIVEQHIFVNASFRYYAYKAMLSRNLSQRIKGRFIFVRPSRVTDTLLKFIPPENIPIQYGGFQRDDEDEFTEKNAMVSEMPMRGSISTIEFPVTEPGVTVVWDIAVVGWEVEYMEEFIPEDEGSYKVLIRKEKKLEETTRNSFYISEPGKVVLTVANRTMKKKKILYRWKSKPTVPLYNMIGANGVV